MVSLSLSLSPFCKINRAQIHQSHYRPTCQPGEKPPAHSKYETALWAGGIRNGTPLKCEGEQDATGRQMIGRQDHSETR